MKEEFTINKPHIANEFTQMFFSQAEVIEEKSNTNKVKLYYKIGEDEIKTM